MGVGTAIGVGVGGSLAGAAMQSSAAGHAADTQAAAAEQAAQLQHQDAQDALHFQENQYQQGQRNLAPYLATGYGGLANLSYLMGIPFAPGETYQLPGGGGSSGTAPGPSIPPLPGSLGGSPAGMRSPTQFSPVGSLDGGGRLPPVGPGTVPHTLTPGGVPGAAGANAYNAAQPMSSLVNKNLGGFGSLAAPWTEQFQAPTALTEQNDPGYQERLNLGMQNMQRSAAARGNLLTGGTLKDLNQFGQDYASNEYGNVYNRALGRYDQRYNIFKQNQTDLYNRLASMSGIGQTTASTLGELGQNAAGNVGNILLSSGQQIGNQLNNAAAARASGYVGSANAWGGALSGGANSISQMLMMQNLMNGGGGNPSSGAIASTVSSDTLPPGFFG